MMKLQENSKQLSFLIICFSQKPTFEVLSAILKTLTANKLCFLVQLVIRGVRRTQRTPPGESPHLGIQASHYLVFSGLNGHLHLHGAEPLYRAMCSKFSPFTSHGSPPPPPPPTAIVGLRAGHSHVGIYCIRERDRALYVGLQHVVPSTNTKFKAITSSDSSGYAIHKHSQAQNIIFQSHFWVQLSAGSPFLLSDKNRKFLQFFHNNNNNNIHYQLLQTGFLRVY